MFVIKENYDGQSDYVAISYPNWLDLLNGTTENKECATRFHSEKEANDFKKKLEYDGYAFAGVDVYDRFEVVRF